jgi:hypothetical protein
MSRCRGLPACAEVVPHWQADEERRMKLGGRARWHVRSLPAARDRVDEGVGRCLDDQDDGDAWDPV